MIEAHNIHKSYINGKETTEVLRGVNVDIKEGSFVAVVGPSGAGKSTLLHILGGLDAPTRGTVAFEGRDVYKASDKALARVRNKRFGFVFQFYHLLPEFSVLENVLMPSRIGAGFRRRKRAVKEYASELLHKAGLAERMHYYPNQLSGGEKQRVAIVRGLINEPSVLFCDEPTGNLDSQTGDEVLSLIRNARRLKRMAVVLVTHNMELTKGVDRVYQLRDGVLVS